MTGGGQARGDFKGGVYSDGWFHPETGRGAVGVLTEKRRVRNPVLKGKMAVQRKERSD